MGSHPLNLAIRFCLELVTLGIAAFWGFKRADNWTRYIIATGLVVFLAAIWGTFAVPDDPSRSGSAPIPVNGVIRLII